MRKKICRCSTTVGLLAVFTVCGGTAAASGPVDFGRTELNRALRERGLSEKAIATQIRPGPAESWSIRPGVVSGADDRGLMYGLLEAADQIRVSGTLTTAAGRPATPMRGIRYFIHNEQLEERWFYSREHWRAYFAMLARNRFNRYNLVFAHQTNYLAPPYPFWVDVAEFPQIRVPGLTSEQRERNLEMLRYISQTAADHGVDFTLGVWEHNAQDNQTPMVEGLTAANIGPYSHAALRKLLAACPAIRSVQMRTNRESGIPDDRQVEFYEQHVFPAIRDAGRILDLRAWAVAGGMIDAARKVGVTTRVSTKYWAEHMGRPYQPAETRAGYSYMGFLEKPRWYEFYWELWGLGSHRLLLWGNPEFVRRVAPTLRLSASMGFEIDAPPTQKGFGNRPGTWDVFTPAERARLVGTWDFERYWLFYRLWGRVTYDPAVSDEVWMRDMRARFGAAADDVMRAYLESSRVIGEIVAVHLADPNMYVWPELNPGGLIDSYMEVPPSDPRYVASFAEQVHDLLAGAASAKQTAEERAAAFEGMAQRIDAAVAAASSKIHTRNAEWEGSWPDFRVLASLARYHAHKQRGAINLAWHDATGDAGALQHARNNLTAALEEWEKLATFTDGLYSTQFANGPDDVGHWKDKLPYVRHDPEAVREREEIFARFGPFDFGFDFGAAVAPAAEPSFRSTPYVRGNHVAPRFRAVAPETLYDDTTGYGWARPAALNWRELTAIALTPYKEVRAVARVPYALPRDVLFRDFIRGQGDQVFLVKAPPAMYQVYFLSPDRTVRTESIAATDGLLRVRFPRGDWTVSGLVIKRSPAESAPPPFRSRRALPRPEVRHTPPPYAQAGKPLRLLIEVGGVAAASVRLHYRALNQNEAFRTLEGNGNFTIPGEHIPSRFDLMYYFEILNDEKSGWFYPDPATTTPYIVVETRK
jgi:hypothetical protein